MTWVPVNKKMQYFAFGQLSILIVLNVHNLNLQTWNKIYPKEIMKMITPILLSNLKFFFYQHGCA